MLDVIQFVIILLFPLYALGFIIIPLGAIYSAITRSDRSKTWRYSWAFASLLWLPGFVYGAVFFKNIVARIFTWVIVLLLIVAFGGTIYFNYDRADGDIVQAGMYFFEKERHVVTDKDKIYMQYLEKVKEQNE